MRLKLTILNAVAAITFMFAPIAVPVVAHAASCGSGESAKGQVLQGIGQTGNDCDDSQVDQVFKTVVQLLSMIVGIVAVIAIIYAGFKYITSGGESGRVSNAKSTLLYALVGLGVAALAQLLVQFVLFQTNKR